MDLKTRIAQDLAEARSRTEELLAPLDDERLTTQFDQLMSPPVWDYTHIGVFEELWLVSRLSGAAPLDEELLHTYDAIETPRVVRGRRRLIGRADTELYVGEVRKRTLGLLEEIDFESEDALLANGFIYQLVLQHEDQLEETILQTIQLTPGKYVDILPTPPVPIPVTPSMVEVPAGTYPIGKDTHEPYDNERPLHHASLPAFAIDRFPTTNGDFLSFMADDGYLRQDLWSEAGWEWKDTFGVDSPEYWAPVDGSWASTRFGHQLPVDPRLPVMHVSWFEAEAYARWAGKRLPTEFEWEIAAGWDPITATKRKYPWGDDLAVPDLANLDQSLLGPAPIGAYPNGASPFGCEQMAGDVWEWTSSDFTPYPGFVAFPYSEYSEPFFGGPFKVLRGGSWATRGRVARTTFRNWDSPLKRQIFAGFRLARSV